MACRMLGLSPQQSQSLFITCEANTIMVWQISLRPSWGQSDILYNSTRIDWDFRLPAIVACQLINISITRRGHPLWCLDRKSEMYVWCDDNKLISIEKAPPFSDFFMSVVNQIHTTWYKRHLGLAHLNVMRWLVKKQNYCGRWPNDKTKIWICQELLLCCL